MKKSTIHFIRHGQTLYNLQRRIQGSIDIELSELGVKQARAVPSEKFLSHYDISYHSPLSRSQKTLEIILDSNKINVEKKLSKLITERAYGCFEGLQNDIIKLKYPNHYENWKINENTEIKGAETIESVVNRINSFIKKMIIDDHQNILAVTHSGVLYALYKYITKTDLGFRPKDIKFPNCCSVYLDIYHTDKVINRLELQIQDQTYVYGCGPTEVVIATS